MIFLKKFEAKGFKSFADMTKLNFDSAMIGIVGPNGSGKSNVIDAIKWVLGEKSIKSLRGKKSDDIIFHGSNSKPKSEFAEVTLTFDNTSRVLHIDLDEVAVTRRLYRGDGNNDYFINGEQVRLKDLLDVFVDTGLSKGSLGIISQGTINWFADSKPEDRRTIFEEAAGIGLYIRRKEETLRQLERTQTNLDRLTDITKELQRDIKKLEVQASKVKEYKEKKEELTKLEISIIVKDVVAANKELDYVSKMLNESRNSNITLEPKLNALIEELIIYKDKLEQSDIKVSKFSFELNEIINKINKLEIEKSIIDNDLKLDINSSDYSSKVDALYEIIVNLDKEINSKKIILDRNKNEFEIFNNQLVELDINRNDFTNSIYDLTTKNVTNKTNLTHLEDTLRNKPNHDGGSKAILNNKDALTGILGSVMDFIKCDPEHAQAITIALGKNVQNIVVNTIRDARRCIDFLVNNKAGVTTFMPVYEMKPKLIKPEHLEIMQHIDGFVGVASNLILKLEKKIQPVIDSILGRIVIATTLEAASEISKYTFSLYKIITLDGQIINPQGSITGGYTKLANDGFIGLETRIKEVKKVIESEEAQINKLRIKLKENDLASMELRNKIAERKANIFKFDDQIKNLETEMIKYKLEYEKLSKKAYEPLEGNKSEFTLINEKLNLLLNTKEKVENDLYANQNNKKLLKKKIYEIEETIDLTRKAIDKNKDIILEFDKKELKNINIIDNAKNKLNDTYKMTIETAIESYSEPLTISDNVARQKIEKLNKEIGYMGNMNMDAINELKEKSERYDKMKAEELEIAEAKDDLLNSISELDKKAHEDFSNTINKINEELPKTFKYLFGGGDCRIEYTDPNNILTSGIEVKACPPGKHINSLFALSGGEKTLVALSVLFSILKISSFPLVILDEGESALDPSNVERFANIIHAFSNETQFLVITHRPLTMEKCDKLYGATMLTKGVTTMIHVTLSDAIKNYANDKPDAE
ncbi:AAA family ATPase [Malacoplasma muris]|uniref:AAA family ATPase n=1 Tax=Malacoplasma muris TaxID=2119 RepID=UPI00398E3341